MLGRAIILLAASLCFITTQVNALGLGEVTLESTLNQPLRARIELLDLGESRTEEINVQIASVEDFQRFNIDRSRFISNIKFSVETANGRNYVVLSSSQVVREPYLSFILDTRWPSGRLLSEHTLLLDLPVFNDQQKTATPTLPVSNSAVFSAASDSASTTATGISADNLVATAEPVPAPITPAAAAAPTAQIQNPTPVAEPPADVDLEPVIEQAEQSIASIDTAEQTAQQLQTAQNSNAQIQRLAEAITDEEAIPDSVEITASDTLWDVALRVRPDDSVSVQQTMLAIQRLNPDAFADGNINRLLSGEVVRVPDLSEIRSVDQGQAIAEVSRQNQATGIGVEPLIAPANGPATQNRTQQGQLSVVTVDSSTDNSTNAAGPAADDDAELDQRIVELENSLALSQENSDRAELEREELNARLGSIELQINSAQEIIDLQDLQLAQLQQSIVEAANNAVEVAQAEIEQPQDDESVDALIPGAAAQNTTSVATPPQSSQPGFVENLLATVEQNLVLAGAGLAVVVLALVMLMLRRKRHDEFEDVAMAGVAGETFAAADGEALAHASADEEDTLDDNLKELQVGTAEADLDDLVDLGADLEEDVLQEVSAELNSSVADVIVDESTLDTTQDVLEQVGVFTQYKQFDEAKNLLEGRLETEPDNDQLRLALAEIFVEQQDQSAFAEQESILNAATDTATITALAQLKEKFAVADEDLFLSDEVDEVAERDVEDTGVAPEEVAETDSSFDSVEFSSEENTNLASEEVDDEIVESSSADNNEQDSDELESFSFDLEKGEDEAATDAVELESADAATEEKNQADVSIDFDDDNEALETAEDAAIDHGQSDAEAPDSELSAADNSIEFESDNAEEDDKDNDSSEPNKVDFESAIEDASNQGVSSEVEQDVEAEPASAQSASDVADDSDEIESFDFELDSLDGDTVIEKPMFSADASDDNNVDDFDFDLDEFEVDNDISAAADQGTDLDLDEEIKELDMELSDDSGENSSENQDTDAIDFDLNSAMDFATEVKTDTSDKPDYVGGELDNLEFTASEEDSQLTDSSDSDFGDMDMLSEDDEAATKLELAYAYQKMGDDNGAREILEEIITDGNGPQISEAKELLNSLGPAK